MAVQNVDLVKPMLDQAFTFALLAMANAARFEYTHHGIKALENRVFDCGVLFSRQGAETPAAGILEFGPGPPG